MGSRRSAAEPKIDAQANASEGERLQSQTEEQPPIEPPREQADHPQLPLSHWMPPY